MCTNPKGLLQGLMRAVCSGLHPTAITAAAAETSPSTPATLR